MKFLAAEPTPPRPKYIYAPLAFLWRYTVPSGLVLGLGLGAGLSAVSHAWIYFIPKELVLGMIAGLVAPLLIELVRRFIPKAPDPQRDMRHYLMYYFAGLGAGIVVLVVNVFFPLDRPLLDPANLLYPLGTAGSMLLIGFIADTMWAERTERSRTRIIFGKYVSESIAQRVLDTQARVPPEGEERIATVLISDIRGFTRMIQELGAEQVVHTLNEYFTRMIDVIARYDGTVNKFIGDAIVVLYNAPLAQPDANERAIATARAMQIAVREMNARRAESKLPPLRIGVAIDVGPVICGNVGSPKRLEYTAIGAPVNTAYHLASLAPAEQIYITENVCRALNDSVSATLVQQVELKGGTGTLNVYKLN